MTAVQDRDVCYMQKALEQAAHAFATHEVPVGAVVVDDKENIIGAGFNQVETKKTQQAHAECQAIAQAVAHRGDWRLDGCTIYVTLEPCVMCMGLISLSRIKRVVYGADSPLFGYQLDNNLPTWVYNGIEVKKGIAAAQSADLLKRFFQEKRKKR